MTTEVMPAIAPAKSLNGVVNSVSPTGINNYRINTILTNTPHLLGVTWGGGILVCKLCRRQIDMRYME